jgi:hypothetical protein
MWFDRSVNDRSREPIGMIIPEINWLVHIPGAGIFVV